MTIGATNDAFFPHTAFRDLTLMGIQAFDFNHLDNVLVSRDYPSVQLIDTDGNAQGSVDYPPVVAGVVCCSYWSRSRMTWCCLYTLLVKMIMGCYMGDNYTMLYSTVFPLNYIIIRHRLPRSLRQSLTYQTRLHNL